MYVPPNHEPSMVVKEEQVQILQPYKVLELEIDLDVALVGLIVSFP